LHEIGKTLVGTLLTANGFKVTDIGIDKPASEFITAVKETGATLVGALALLTTTIPEQQKIIEALEEAGLSDKVKVMVGGAPVTKAWANKIGADGAVAVAKKLVEAYWWSGIRYRCKEKPCTQKPQILSLSPRPSRANC